MNRRSILPGFFAFGLLAAAPLLRAADSPILDALNASDATGFARLLGATGRAESLGSKPYTLLAPVDAALPLAKVEELLRPGNATAAAKFVDGHLIPQALDERELKRRRAWTTASGEDVAVALERGKLTLGGARVVGGSKRVGEGYVYRLEKPLGTTP